MMVTAAACLAFAVYHEARGEPIDGQKAVAEVILTRAAHSSFPSTVCEVVKENRFPESRPWACQFSFYCDGKDDKASNAAEWEVAKKVAQEALDGDILGIGATHYHTLSVSPSWRHGLEALGSIGSHVFYSDGGCTLPSCSPRPKSRPERN